MDQGDLEVMFRPFIRVTVMVNYPGCSKIVNNGCKCGL